jgi:signal peptidase I
VTVVRWSRRILSAAFVALAVTVLAVGLGARIGPALGFEVFAIRSGSMAPAIPVGALAIVERRADSPHTGESVAFRVANGVVVTHRVVQVVPMDAGVFLRTKGDANRTADPNLVPAAAVIGPVSQSIPLLGYLLGMLGMPIGLVSILSLAATLIAAIWLLEDVEEAAGPVRRSALARSLEA